MSKPSIIPKTTRSEALKKAAMEKKKQDKKGNAARCNE
jgi:hypothetical protein